MACRPLILLCLGLLASLWLAGAAPVRAAEPVTLVLRTGQSPAEIAATLDALRTSDRPVTIRWESAPEPGAPAAPSTRGIAPLGAAFLEGLSVGLGGLARLAELPRALAAAWTRSGSPAALDGALRLALVVAGALGIAWLADRLRAAALAVLVPRSAPPADLLGRFGLALQRFAGDLGVLAVAWLAAGLLLDDLLPGGSFAPVVGERLIRAGLMAGLYLVVGRFLLHPGRHGRPLLPTPRPRWHLGMMLAYGGGGAVISLTVTLAQAAGADPTVVQGWFLLAASALTLQKLVWFGAGRHDIATTFRGGAAPEAVGLPRRLGAATLPWIFIATALLIWVVGSLVAGAPQRIHWGYAAGATQILVILVPVVALGIDALAQSLIVHRLEPASLTPLQAALVAVTHSLVVGGCWVAGLYAIAAVWDFYLPDPSSAETVETVRFAWKLVACLAAGWIAWRFLRTYFEAHMPAPRSALPSDEDESELQIHGRLATVMPVIRDLSLGLVAALTLLVVLATIGVEVGPLIAGFGVLGLAISFGSQALVRDVVSGIFFMSDDAFRLGEYIETGRLRGTVEKISLRSVQLRHQSGQVHTVPFGQLQAVTNFSRDWSTVKFLLRLDRSAPIEVARRTIKRVGAEMMADPELAPELILPLKLQGIHDVTETAIVVRLKFTCRPVKPTFLQREALKRILPALQAAGVRLATNAVVVHAPEPADADRAAGGAAAAVLPAPAAS